MSEAQFKAGQPVCRGTGGWLKDMPAGQFIVLEVLSEDRWGRTSYRVCGLSDGLVRVMMEHELRCGSEAGSRISKAEMVSTAA